MRSNRRRLGPQWPKPELVNNFLGRRLAQSAHKPRFWRLRDRSHSPFAAALLTCGCYARPEARLLAAQKEKQDANRKHQYRGRNRRRNAKRYTRIREAGNRLLLWREPHPRRSLR